jgi:carotenoid 1,2-hydratase
VEGVVPAAGLAHPAHGALSRGRERPSWTGGADGGPVGAGGRVLHPGRLRFDEPVPASGYVWWYLDALSEDGRHGLTIIAFIGSVFSPYYRFARRKGPADPMRFCAMNAVVYGPGGRFALTERGHSAVARDGGSLAIGRSAMRFDGTTLTVDIDEIAAPLPQRVRGRVRLRPSGFTPGAYALDAAGRHRWWPIAPASRAEVSFDAPGMSWQGPAYFDTNAGDRPLEDDFADWWWCRAPLPGGGAGVLYEVARRDGSRQLLSLGIDPDGTVEHRRGPPPATLPAGRIWRMPRPARCDEGAEPRVVRTFEDTPFYTRSEIETSLFGQRTRAVHESLSMDRFVKPWVQMLLPFRMPRAL